MCRLPLWATPGNPITKGDELAVKTVIMIVHNLSVIQNADQILVLSKGKIVEQGVHNELMHTRGKYYTMWQAQREEAGGIS